MEADLFSQQVTHNGDLHTKKQEKKKEKKHANVITGHNTRITGNYSD
jgi:hypothetical protein